MFYDTFGRCRQYECSKGFDHAKFRSLRNNSLVLTLMFSVSAHTYLLIKKLKILKGIMIMTTSRKIQKQDLVLSFVFVQSFQFNFK